MKKILSFFKKRYIYIVLYVVVIFSCFVELPYYIDAPGGLINVSERIKVDGKYESEGSINLAYVTEYSVNLPMLIASYFNDDWTLNKIETKEEQIDHEESFVRDKLLMEEAYANAIIVAYRQAGKEIVIDSSDVYVAYLLEEAKTDLVIGDRIVKIDNQLITSKADLKKYLNQQEAGTKIKFIVQNGDKEKEKFAEVIEYEDEKIIGFVPVEINRYKTNPYIEIPTESSEYGPSGGLMVTLAVYDAITEVDITGGLTIVGTGTIALDGTVGSIGGVEYKIKGAIKKDADVFFVPVGENYEEAKKLVEEKKYDLVLVPVANVEDALKYLFENVVK